MKQRWRWSQVTDEEYRANLDGMNTFFGAVIGFVLADVRTAHLIGFAQLLVYTAAIVIGILYVSASRHRWLYVALNLLLIATVPRLLVKSSGDLGRLQVTLAVWCLMAALVEAWLAWQRWSKRDKTPG